jgi:hypothetical protein
MHAEEAGRVREEDDVLTTPQRSSAAFLAGIKNLKFLLPSQRTETSHA